MSRIVENGILSAAEADTQTAVSRTTNNSNRTTRRKFFLFIFQAKKDGGRPHSGRKCWIVDELLRYQ